MAGSFTPPSIPKGLKISPEQLAAAAKYTPARKGGKPVAMPGKGLLGRVGIPLAAAAVPLALKEWVGGGYRSGKKPAQELVAANQAMHEAPKSGLFDRVKKTFGGG